MHKYEHTVEATGTQWSVTWWTPELFDQDSHKLWESCLILLENFESMYSRFDSQSFLSKLECRSGRLMVPQNFVKMLEIYSDFYELSEGRITPLGGRVISDMGYDRDYSFVQKKGRLTVPGFPESVKIVSDQEVRINEGLTFDFGALGKGFLIDLTMEHIRKQGNISRILINAGGDIAHYASDGKKARIALEHPEDPKKALGVVELGNEALASSGIGKRIWGDKKQLHHIYDPTTGDNNTSIQASWIIHDSAAIADALATSLFLTDPSRLLCAYDFDYALITTEKMIQATKRFQEAFTN